MSDLDTADTGANVELPETPAVEAVETPATEQETTTATEDEHKETRRKKGVQERINELTREKYEKAREAQELREQLERIQTQQYQPQAPSAEPTLADYNYDETAYRQAVIAYAKNEADRVQREQIEQFRQQQAQTEQQRKYQEIFSEHQRREERFMKEAPDYQESVEYLTGSVKYDPALVEVIGTSDKSPEILYHLATHFEEAVKLAEMPLHLATAHLVRLEAKLATPKKPVSQAPAPAPSLSGSSVFNKDPSSMSDAEWYEYRKNQSRKS